MWRCPKWHKTICFTIIATCGIFSKYPKHNGGALWGIPNLENQCFSMFAVFAVFSKFWKKSGVALCGAIPKFEK